jgi:hypothetical protein
MIAMAIFENADQLQQNIGQVSLVVRMSRSVVGQACIVRNATKISNFPFAKAVLPR